MSLLWLKNVPWGTILANAPGLVDGAKRLAAAIRKPAESEGVADADDEQSSRLLRIEEQQQAAADLLRSLADQNAQMAQALVALRQRAKIHLRIAIIALVLAAGALVWTIVH